MYVSLNPYCAGRCSSTGTPPSINGSRCVSILIVLDDALVLMHEQGERKNTIVSILIVLDDALVLMAITCLSCMSRGLNPYCAGRCSSTRETETILIINMLQNYAKVIFAFLNQKLTIS